MVIHSNRKVPVDFQARANYARPRQASVLKGGSGIHPKVIQDFDGLMLESFPTNPTSGGVDACMNGAAGYILTLGVVDAARGVGGHGLAKQLLQKTMESIRQQLGAELKAIWVHVVEYNAPATWLIQPRGKNIYSHG